MNRVPSTSIEINSYIRNHSILETVELHDLDMPYSPLDDDELLSIDENRYDYTSILANVNDALDATNRKSDGQFSYVLQQPISRFEQYFNYKGGLKVKPEISKDTQYDLQDLPQSFVTEVLSQDFMAYVATVMIREKRFFGAFKKGPQFAHNSKVDLNNCTITIGPFSEQKAKIRVIFTHILQFTREYDSVEPHYFHAKRVIEMTIHETQIMKDEIYLQLIKQINLNTTSSLLYYFQLTALYCTFVAPSQKFINPLLNFFYRIAVDNCSAIYQSYCKYIIKRVCSTFRNQNRIIFPSDDEIQKVLLLKPILFRVHVYRDKYAYIEYNPDITATQVLNQVARQLDLKSKYLCICLLKQCNNTFEEIYIQGNDKIFSILTDVSQTMNTIIEFRQSQNTKETKLNYKLILKCLKIHDIFENMEHFYLAYSIATQDYLNGFYNLDDQQIARIGAYKLVADFGSQINLYKLDLKLHEYMPRSMTSLYTKEEWLQRLSKIYYAEKIPNPRYARCMILEILQQQYRFLGMTFDCTYHEKLEHKKYYNQIQCVELIYMQHQQGYIVVINKNQQYSLYIMNTIKCLMLLMQIQRHFSLKLERIKYFQHLKYILIVVWHYR